MSVKVEIDGVVYELRRADSIWDTCDSCDYLDECGAPPRKCMSAGVGWRYYYLKKQEEKSS